MAWPLSSDSAAARNCASVRHIGGNGKAAGGACAAKDIAPMRVPSASTPSVRMPDLPSAVQMLSWTGV